MTQEFTITEKPIPSPHREARLKYPLAELKPGTEQSFIVPAVTSEAVKKASASVRTFAYRNGMAVKIRTEDNAIRVWRSK